MRRGAVTLRGLRREVRERRAIWRDHEAGIEPRPHSVADRVLRAAASPATPDARPEPMTPERRELVHLRHCNFGEWAGACKYGPEKDCPALTEWGWLPNAYRAATPDAAALRTAVFGVDPEPFYDTGSNGIDLDGYREALIAALVSGYGWVTE